MFREEALGNRELSDFVVEFPKSVAFVGEFDEFDVTAVSAYLTREATTVLDRHDGIRCSMKAQHGNSSEVGTQCHRRANRRETGRVPDWPDE